MRCIGTQVNTPLRFAAEERCGSPNQELSGTSGRGWENKHLDIHMSVCVYQVMGKGPKRKGGKMPKEKMTRTSLRLPESLWKAARIKSIEDGIDAQEIVARALAAYLRKGGAK